MFNCKALSKSIGHFFGLNNNEYRDFILRQINGNNAHEIVKAIAMYLPEEIPQNID